MAIKPAAPVIERLESQECWRLLRQVSVGRRAVWLQEGPDIFPVNYTTDHGTVVLLTGEGAKLQAALGDFRWPMGGLTGLIPIRGWPGAPRML